MITELQAYCRETQQTVPESPGELARCIYDNLALCYSVELEKISSINRNRTENYNFTCCRWWFQ